VPAGHDIPLPTPTAELEVRVASPDDAAAVAAFYARGATFFAPFEPFRAPGALEAPAIHAALVIEQADPSAGRTILAIDPGSGHVVGRARVSNVARGPFQSASLGYGVDEAWNGRGIAQRLVRAAIALAFGELGLHRLEAGTLLDNLASQRVLERCGFGRIGISPRHLQIAGRWSDHVLFCITREDVDGGMGAGPGAVADES
jgi:ribosomal-protein-alanine N-acetyltransferase